MLGAREAAARAHREGSGGSGGELEEAQVRCRLVGGRQRWCWRWRRRGGGFTMTWHG